MTFCLLILHRAYTFSILSNWIFFFYSSRLGKFDHPLETRLGNYGEIASRKAIRDKMSCKSFKWYLDNVAKGLPYHQLLGAGEIRNPSYDFCLDQNDRTEFINSPVYCTGCHGEAGNQYWWLNANWFLMRDYTCIGKRVKNIHSSFYPCSCLVNILIEIFD